MRLMKMGIIYQAAQFLANTNYPLTLMYGHNKEIQTNITGSKNFNWYVSLL